MNARQFKRRNFARSLPCIVCGHLLLPIAAHSQANASSSDPRNTIQLSFIARDRSGNPIQDVKLGDLTVLDEWLPDDCPNSGAR